MKFIAALFATFILIIILLADSNKLPAFIQIIYNIPNGDKLGHFALFGILNYLTTRASLASLPRLAPGRVALTVGLILAVAIALEEYSQRFFPSRTSDWGDLLASWLGATLGGWLAYLWTKKL